jgi:hypothetical protein
MTTADPPRRTGRPPLPDDVKAARAAEREAKRSAPRTRNGRLCIAHEPLAALAGRVPDVVLAAVLGCSASAIRKIRKQRDLPAPGDAWAEDGDLVRQVVEAARAKPFAGYALGVIARWVDLR